MRIAIATESADPSSEVSPQGARAAYFLIFDEREALVEALANPLLDMDRMVGPNVARPLSSKGVVMVVAGRIGTHFAGALAIEGIEHRAFGGVAKQVAASAIRELLT